MILESFRALINLLKIASNLENRVSIIEAHLNIKPAKNTEAYQEAVLAELEKGVKND